MNPKNVWSLIILALTVTACPERNHPVFNQEEYAKQILHWREQRVERLTTDNGWLSLVGLFWLHAGKNTVGSDRQNNIVLPADVPPLVGIMTLSDTGVRFDAMQGVPVKVGDSPVTALLLKSDSDTGGPTILTYGTVSFYVIARGKKIGVRVKDAESETRLKFAGLEYFPIDPKWQFIAQFKPHNPPHTLSIPSEAGTMELYPNPGMLEFAYNDSLYSLEAVSEEGSEDQLFLMFNDKTNGEETYGGGRQLYTALPDDSGRVLLDFNKAYNWPCVFTPFATCPIPPPSNRLPIRVEAGEKMYEEHH